MVRTGCLYTEWRNNPGRGVINAGRLRWVAEISIERKRYRFRSTNRSNAVLWLDKMCGKYNTQEL